jgi:hypothetical protein
MKASGELNMLRVSGAGGVVVSLLALVLILLVPPMFMMPIGTRYYAGAGGAVFGFLAGAMSAWAFVACPRRIIPKTLTFVLLLPTLYLAFRYVSAFLAYGPRT